MRIYMNLFVIVIGFVFAQPIYANQLKLRVDVLRNHIPKDSNIQVTMQNENITQKSISSTRDKHFYLIYPKTFNTNKLSFNLILDGTHNVQCKPTDGKAYVLFHKYKHRGKGHGEYLSSLRLIPRLHKGVYFCHIKGLRYSRAKG